MEELACRYDTLQSRVVVVQLFQDHNSLLKDVVIGFDPLPGTDPQQVKEIAELLNEQAARKVKTFGWGSLSVISCWTSCQPELLPTAFVAPPQSSYVLQPK